MFVFLAEAEKVVVPPGWKPEPFTKECNPHGLFEESFFARTYPKYREKYIREVWPLVKARLAEHVSGPFSRSSLLGAKSASDLL